MSCFWSWPADRFAQVCPNDSMIDSKTTTSLTYLLIRLRLAQKALRLVRKFFVLPNNHSALHCLLASVGLVS